ncbi:protein CREG1-like [Acanthaster planci]|uniref:Protein CREG1-like n=1 Tax=Acanthaster planci TaxID=133434 RepID=A0A8B7ZEJ7_ACAPL|nr:protein CREG1-like [Acanthaster planci]
MDFMASVIQSEFLGVDLRCFSLLSESLLQPLPQEEREKQHYTARILQLTLAIFLENTMISLVTATLLLLSCTVIKGADPPPHGELAKRARYIVHKADWCIITTFSSTEVLLGQPFPNPASVSDGPVNNSSGIPYMYQPTVSYVTKDVFNDSRVTLTFSEAQFGLKECLLTKESDPESPLCARLMIKGNMHLVTDAAENATARAALFPRHPNMVTWGFHEYTFLKMDIKQILLLDYFGGYSYVSVDDYFKANLN